MEEQKKSTYTPAVKKAIDKYRKNNIDKINEKQREYYNEYKQNEEWRKNFNEKCRINNQKYRQKKKESLGEVKPRGRPRKTVPPLDINLISKSI